MEQCSNLGALPAAEPVRSGAAAMLARAWGASTRRSLLLRSPDREAAEAMVGKVFRAHRLEPQAGARLAVEMELLQGGLVGLSALRYGATVDIHPQPLERFFLLQIPLRGQAQIDSCGQAFVSDPGCGSLLSPSPRVHMRWHAGNEQLCLRIEAETLTRFLAAWCGEDAVAAPTFDPRFSLQRHPHLVALLQQLLNCAEHAQEGAGALSLSALNLQYQLLAMLLSHQPHDRQPLLAHQCPPVAPRSVRRVEEYLVAHCDQAVTPESLAALAGVSVRSLFLGFQRYRGTSPMRLLRQLRMQRVHQELLQAPEQARVTDIALRWGFCHLGRFSLEYRATYGESPSETLRCMRRESALARAGH